ncbi:MAG: type II toxin-antitoxin system VapC family toxin [Anaerolineales bacterium]|nr:type II toxin-antitoxin system VapC family toxin [Anaerolineales bacterium]
MNRAVCVEASFIVAMLTPERYTTLATTRWKTWIEDDFRILTPTLLGYEVSSALYRKVLKEQIEPKDGKVALEQFLSMDIESIHLPELHTEASKLAKQFNRPNVYAAHYLALARHLACPLWTADERLYNTVKEKFEWIKWVEE